MIVAFIQARSDSTRLPGKVLKPILGKPMIIHMLQRVSKSKKIDKLLLLTSNQKNDDELAETVKKYGFEVFRGDKENVLNRFYEAGKKLHLKDNDIVIRLTGDCPLHDAKIIDEMIEEFLQRDVDYLSNTAFNPVHPDGFDVEIFNFKALKVANEKATKKSQKEHVTPFMRDSGLFKIASSNKKPIHPDWKLSVDEKEDFELIKNIFEHFNSTYFSFEEIVDYLEKNSKLLGINKHIIINEGYLKPLLIEGVGEKNG